MDPLSELYDHGFEPLGKVDSDYFHKLNPRVIPLAMRRMQPVSSGQYQVLIENLYIETRNRYKLVKFGSTDPLEYYKNQHTYIQLNPPYGFYPSDRVLQMICPTSF